MIEKSITVERGRLVIRKDGAETSAPAGAHIEHRIPHIAAAYLSEREMAAVRIGQEISGGPLAGVWVRRTDAEE